LQLNLKKKEIFLSHFSALSKFNPEVHNEWGRLRQASNSDKEKNKTFPDDPNISSAKIWGRQIASQQTRDAKAAVYRMLAAMLQPKL
jgi:hypothetical protein